MKVKKILVSDDNQLVVGDYGLNESDVEIIDLNKSLHDVVEDAELIQFIQQNIIDPEKIYIFCVKEDFKTNEQLIEDISDIKIINKSLNKIYKKQKNIYFFVYNTYMKKDDAINPTLDQQSAFSPSLEATEAENLSTIDATEVYDSNDNANVEFADMTQPNGESLPAEGQADFSVEYSQPQDVAVEGAPVDAYANENVDFNDILVDDASSYDNAGYQDGANQDSAVMEFVADETFADNGEFAAATNDSQINVTDMQADFSNEGQQDFGTIDETPVDVSGIVETPTEETAVVEALVDENVSVEAQNGETVLDLNVEQAPVETMATQESAVNEDIAELNQIVDGIDQVSTEQDEMIRQSNASNTIASKVESVTSDEIFDEKEYTFDETTVLTDPTVNLDSVETVAIENNPENDRIVFNNKLDNSVDMPETYFDTENEEEISYEDYNEFVNDYELNIHTLKSIYDFIWRILVLNNHNLRLNDLLYIAVNNLDAFSIGQSDFVRQTANKAESLFDLILQLDIKLEFNNSLFYIYLAQFFTISGNKIIVNDKFLNTLSIWVDKASKKRFVEQIEQFMNYSSVYNKKIIFSYFVELANFIKGCLPTIKPNISLVDIHRILTNPSKKVRSENIFGFMVDKINSIFKDSGIIAEMYLVNTPENIFGVDESTKLDPSSDSWKTQLTILYKKLVENILNYILLKGNKESDIFNMYIDIKDLRMYKNLEIDKNLLSPETIDALSQVSSSYSYATIGDALNREQAIVPSQTNNDTSLTSQYLSGLENGVNFNNANNYQSNSFVNRSEEMQQYPDSVVFNTTKPSSSLMSKYTSKFNMSEFENAMSRRIEEYEKKIKDNIARIEAERKQLRQKMEDLKNI